ncbi:PREDICTED: uncharacterized protein LOC102004709 [Chinchilla lanigera]|uniref:uncharacterized protein LOC102004709 n=1 Tax=Chinchilla lanigera TaxID=34839 RepID=UPI00038F0198|nr:PREDICTED: uncharacterized protein LOC102004709 [Chinchilla lanigera]
MCRCHAAEAWEGPARVSSRPRTLLGPWLVPVRVTRVTSDFHGGRRVTLDTELHSPIPGDTGKHGAVAGRATLGPLSLPWEPSLPGGGFLTVEGGGGGEAVGDGVVSRPGSRVPFPCAAPMTQHPAPALPDAPTPRAGGKGFPWAAVSGSAPGTLTVAFTGCRKHGERGYNRHQALRPPGPSLSSTPACWSRGLQQHWRHCSGSHGASEGSRWCHTRVDAAGACPSPEPQARRQDTSSPGHGMHVRSSRGGYKAGKTSGDGSDTRAPSLRARSSGCISERPAARVCGADGSRGCSPVTSGVGRTLVLKSPRSRCGQPPLAP